MREYDLPDTLQGLNDFLRYGDAEIKRCENKIKYLNGAIEACREKLRVKGESNERLGKATDGSNNSV